METASVMPAHLGEGDEDLGEPLRGVGGPSELRGGRGVDVATAGPRRWVGLRDDAWARSAKQNGEVSRWVNWRFPANIKLLDSSSFCKKSSPPAYSLTS